MRKIMYLTVLVVLIMAVSGCNGNKANNVEPQKENSAVTNSDNSKVSNTENNEGLNPENDVIKGNTNPGAFERKGISGNFGGVQFGNAAVWPEDIPEDIPKFVGEIQQIMRDAYNIRIFFVNVSDKYMEQYIDLLKDQGFNLEYKIYKREGFPDNSKERQQNKDYDAVTATKGSLKINIEFGGELVTYDIDPRGF